jgi:hypothetical protein
MLLTRARKWLLPNWRPLAWYCVLIIAVTAYHVARGNFRRMMPAQATTSYDAFIGLRVLSLLAFFATYAITYHLCDRGLHNQIVKLVVFSGFVVALASLYFYCAQLYGLPDMPRTRVGTNVNGLQPTVFAYAFHRAMGTFREPSYLAAWLLLPLLLSIRTQQHWVNLYSASMGTVLLLTGSLGGIVSLVSGLVVALFVARPTGFNIKPLIGLAVALLAALGGFYSLARSYTGDTGSLFSTLEPRVEEILTGGVAASDRGYVYAYFSEVSIPLVGSGLGHPALAFTDAVGAPAVTPLLSFYLNTILAAGIILFSLIAVFLLKPLWKAFHLPGRAKTFGVYLMVALYCAWLVLFTSSGEELGLTFGFVYAFVSFEVNISRRVGGGRLGSRMASGATQQVAVRGLARVPIGTSSERLWYR